METLVQIYASNPSVPHNTLQPEIIRLNSTLIAFTDAIIIVRILVRARIVKHVALEDYLMVAAGIVATAFSAMNIVGTSAMLAPSYRTDLALTGTRYGLGRHIYDLPPDTLLENVKKVVQNLWVSQVLYSTALSLVKISIIASFHRIFPTKAIRWIMYGLGGSIIAVWLINIFTTIFQCSPIEAAWNFEAIAPKCLPIMKVYYFSTDPHRHSALCHPPTTVLEAQTPHPGEIHRLCSVRSRSDRRRRQHHAHYCPSRRAEHRRHDRRCPDSELVSRRSRNRHHLRLRAVSEAPLQEDLAGPLLLNGSKELSWSRGRGESGEVWYAC